jgi:hypothetical protein
MCFQLNKDSKPLIADKDITCYKTLRCYKHTELRSSIQGFRYFIGKINPKVRLDVSYASSVTASSNILIHQVKEINRGYHSYIRDHSMGPELLYFAVGIELSFKCTIPKGTKYYMNDLQYVSETIIVNGPVFDPKIFEDPRWIRSQIDLNYDESFSYLDKIFIRSGIALGLSAKVRKIKLIIKYLTTL